MFVSPSFSHFSVSVRQLILVKRERDIYYAPVYDCGIEPAWRLFLFSSLISSLTFPVIFSLSFLPRKLSLASQNRSETQTSANIVRVVLLLEPPTTNGQGRERETTRRTRRTPGVSHYFHNSSPHSVFRVTFARHTHTPDSLFL